MRSRPASRCRRRIEPSPGSRKEFGAKLDDGAELKPIDLFPGDGPFWGEPSHGLQQSPRQDDGP
jgi:hypothetical protein